jgi:SAM-dependent methyltransferase
MRKPIAPERQIGILMAMHPNLAPIYDEFADTYEANRGLFDMSAILDEFFGRLPSAPGDLLDLGCGAGEPFASAFLHRGWTVTGVDCSARMLELARRYAPGMRGILGDMRDVAFKSGQFDAVTLIYSLFHLPTDDQTRLLRRLHDWLKPGGLALFTYAGRDYTGQDSFDGEKEFMGRRLYYGHKTPEALEHDLTAIGFDALDRRYRQIGGETFFWVTIRKPG